MVKSLSDICLNLLATRFDLFVRLKLRLPSYIKEELIHRLINHDRLIPQFLPTITYGLVSANLQVLNIYGSEQLDDTFLEHLGFAQCQLHAVRLIRCPKVTDRGLSDLLSYQSELRILHLRWLGITGSSLLKIQSETLEELDLTGCSLLDPHNVELCVHFNKQISTLKLRGVTRLKTDHLEKIVQTIGSSLRRLNLSDCVELNDFSLRSVADNCPNLVDLQLIDCLRVSGLAIAQIYRGCPRLNSLDVSFCSRLTNGIGSSMTFDQLPSTITRLGLNGVEVSCTAEQFVGSLAALPHLEHLSLSGFNLLSDGMLRQLLSSVGGRLKGLDLSGSFDKITDDSLNSIGEFCQVLEELGISLMSKLNGVGLLPILHDRSRAERLVSLKLANCTELNYLVLESICAGCRNLVTLEVSGIYAFDDHLVSLLADSCPSLTRIFLKGSRNVTDESVCLLAAKCPLKAICLSGLHRVTDKSVFAIANHCHQLQELYLSGCTVISEASKRYLQDCAVGRVAVYHVLPYMPNGSDGVVAKNLDTGEFCRFDS